MTEIVTEEKENKKMNEKNEVEVETEVEAEAKVETETEAETEAEKKEEDFKEKYYYLAAEMDNMRKRFFKEKENILKYGSEKLLSSLIEVVDNLDRTIDALDGEKDKKIKNIVSGVDMVRVQFLDILSKNGLLEVESIGKIFDPNFHEAMAEQSVKGKKDQEIISEYQKGYVLNGRLLRAAKVIIAKK